MDQAVANYRTITIAEWSARLSIGLMYLYSGFDLFLHPKSWYWAIPPWLNKIISAIISVDAYIRVQGLIEVVVAFIFFAWFLKPKIVKYVALISGLEMAGILLLAFLPFKESIFSIVFRDLGVMGGSFALYFLLKLKGAAELPPSIEKEKTYLQNLSQSPRIIWLAMGGIIIVTSILTYFIVSQIGGEKDQTQTPQSPSKSTSTLKSVKEFTIISKENTWSFVPDLIEVNRGDKVSITVVNEDSYDHGFAIDALGINERLPANSTIKVEFVATQSGEYPFYCSVVCGEGIVNGVKRGHFDQVGKLRVK